MTKNSATVKIPNWVRRLDKVPEEAAVRALGTARDYLREETRRNASKGGPRGLRVRSGRLLSSIRTYVKATPKGGTLSLGMVFYGWVNNKGAVITPKNPDGRLKFFIPGAGFRTAARVVLPARPFASDALAATAKKYPSYLSQAIRRSAGK